MVIKLDLSSIFPDFISCSSPFKLDSMKSTYVVGISIQILLYSLISKFLPRVLLFSLSANTRKARLFEFIIALPSFFFFFSSLPIQLIVVMYNLSILVGIELSRTVPVWKSRQLTSYAPMLVYSAWLRFIT